MAATGLETNEHGVPKFDPSTLQCGDAPIFLAGDVGAQRPVLHKASSEGAIAGRNAASFPRARKAKRVVPLSIMFTDPPLATIGAHSSDGMVVGSASYADQGRARWRPQRRPGAYLCRLGHPNNRRGDPLRAGNGPHLHPFARAIERRETADTLLQLPFYHPMFEEGSIRRCAKSAKR